MGRRPLVVMVLGWFAVVGVVGAITFVVVSNAGSGVGRASAAERAVVVSPRTSDAPAPTVTETPTPSARPTSTASPTESTSAQPTRRPDDPEPTTAPSDRRPSAPAGDPRTASFSTQGGIVVASCSGSKVALRSIRPRDDWRFDSDFERGALEVTFKTTEREVEIYLRCVDGVPTRLQPGDQRVAADPTSAERQSRSLVRPSEKVHSGGLDRETSTRTPSPRTSPSTSPSTEETHHD